MRRGIWPAFLALAFIAFGLLGIWDLTWLAFQTLDAIRTQLTRVLEPPAAPTWKHTEPATAGRHVRDIPIGNKGDEGIMALGIDNSGDYAPLIMQSDGAVRAAGKWHDDKTGKDHWVAIRVDPQGRVIISPESFEVRVKSLIEKEKP